MVDLECDTLGRFDLSYKAAGGSVLSDHDGSFTFSCYGDGPCAPMRFITDTNPVLMIFHIFKDGQQRVTFRVSHWSNYWRWDKLEHLALFEMMLDWRIRIK